MMSAKQLLLFAIVSCILCKSITDGYKILIIAGSFSKSQLMFNDRIGNLLADAGHEVVVYAAITHDVQAPKNTKCRFIRGAAGPTEPWKKMMDDETDRIFNTDSVMPGSISELIAIGELFVNYCEAQLINQALMKQLRDEHFDIAFSHMYDPCPIVMIEALGIPTWIWMSSGVLFQTQAVAVGVPTPVSYVPGMMTSFSDRMSFVERAKNAAGYLMFEVFVKYVINQPYNKMVKRHLGADFPTVEQLSSQAPLVFVNSEEFLDFPRPILHKTIYMGGIGMKEGKPVTKDFKKLCDAAKDGIVLFSLGSVINPKDTPRHWRVAFVQAFRRFPTYTFIWRFNVELPEADGVPNVHPFAWLPQKDLLYHPKTKVFITHGGYNSMLESAHAGVPLITIPLFGDQFRNARSAERQGIAYLMDKVNITEDAVARALQTVFENEKYGREAKKLSKMIRKKPMKAEDLVIRWTEFLAEFQKLPHLDVVGKELSFIQYFLLDVIFGLLAAISLFLYISFRIIRFCVCRCCCRKASPKTKKE